MKKEMEESEKKEKREKVVNIDVFEVADLSSEVVEQMATKRKKKVSFDLTRNEVRVIKESRQVKRTKYAGKTAAKTVDKKAIMAYKEKLEKEKHEKEEMERIRALYSSESDEENALCNKLKVQSKVVKRDYEKERKENEERKKKVRVEEQEKKEIDAAIDDLFNSSDNDWDMDPKLVIQEDTTDL